MTTIRSYYYINMLYMCACKIMMKSRRIRGYFLQWSLVMAWLYIFRKLLDFVQMEFTISSISHLVPSSSPIQKPSTCFVREFYFLIFGKVNQLTNVKGFNCPNKFCFKETRKHIPPNFRMHFFALSTLMDLCTVLYVTT